MGHSSESLGLHRGKESGQLPKACSQQDPKFQGRLKQIKGESSSSTVSLYSCDPNEVTGKLTVALMSGVLVLISSAFSSLSFLLLCVRQLNEHVHYCSHNDTRVSRLHSIAFLVYSNL